MVTRKPSPLTYRHYFDRVLEEEIGIAIPVAGIRREYFRNELYECRKLSKDPRYDIVIIFLPNNDEVWMCKKTVELDP